MASSCQSAVSRFGRRALSTAIIAAGSAFTVLTHMLPAGAAPPTSITAEQSFVHESDIAMTKMMADMTIKPTGNIDKDFVAMMVPHHQGAIDMAEVELRYGHNEQLLRICQEIITEQLQEIAAMRIAVGEKVSPHAAMLAASAQARAASPAQTPSHHAPIIRSLTAEKPFLSENIIAMNKMMDDMAVKPAGDIDRDFVAMMIPHHQGAIDMAQVELRYGHSAKLHPIVQEIVVDQMNEIALMRLAVGEALPPSVASPTGAPPTPSTPPANPPMRVQMTPNQMNMEQE